jgi:hypothetical protein
VGEAVPRVLSAWAPPSLFCLDRRPHGIACQTWGREKPRPEPSTTQYKRVGIDASKAAGVANQSAPAQMIPFVTKLPPTEIAMEACGGSHHWARKLIALGYKVRLIPPQYVNPMSSAARTIAMMPRRSVKRRGVSGGIDPHINGDASVTISHETRRRCIPAPPPRSIVAGWQSPVNAGLRPPPKGRLRH